MGEVHRAADLEMGGMHVAVKLLPPLLSRDAGAVEGLRREAAISLRLAHPGICRLHQLEADGDLRFLVMELIEGRTLAQILAARPDRKMTWDELKPLLSQISDALGHAHGLTPPVTHRDIKPANIMVTEGGEAKLLDFGIAREIRDSLTRLSGQQDTSGTLPYMSPEQFRGEKTDAKSDLYSLAAVVYEALAGEPLVNPGGSVSWQILEKPFVPIPGVADEANRMLAAALAKDPAARPARLEAPRGRVVAEKSAPTAPRPLPEPPPRPKKEPRPARSASAPGARWLRGASVIPVFAGIWTARVILETSIGFHFGGGVLGLFLHAVFLVALLFPLAPRGAPWWQLPAVAGAGSVVRYLVFQGILGEFGWSVLSPLTLAVPGWGLGWMWRRREPRPHLAIAIGIGVAWGAVGWFADRRFGYLGIEVPYVMGGVQTGIVLAVVGWLLLRRLNPACRG